jgi:hypothetical protein
MLIEQNEKLILPSPDPAVTKTVGHRRFLIGLDLGQAQDPSAFTVIRDEAVPEWHTGVTQRLRPRQRTVVAADRIRDTSYVEIARIVRNLTLDSALRGRCHLVIDSTGVGRAFGDVLDEIGVAHYKVQMVGGLSENRAGRFWNVSKTKLLSDLNGALHTGKLKLAGFPMREEVAAELDSFQVSFSSAGNMRLEGGDDRGHADMAIATALGWWLSDCAVLNSFVGECKLANFW